MGMRRGYFRHDSVRHVLRALRSAIHRRGVLRGGDGGWRILVAEADEDHHSAGPPSLTVSTVLNVIYVFNSFPIIYTITKGAPANKTDTLITYLYMLAFYDQKKGPATALSVIGFLILCAVAGLYMVISLRKEDQA